jgi:hypothetical protein
MGTIPIVALPLVPHQKRFDFFMPADFVDEFLDDVAHRLAVFNPRRLIRFSEATERDVVTDDEEIEEPIIIYLDWDEVHADEIRSMLFDLLTRHPAVVMTIPE